MYLDIHNHRFTQLGLQNYIEIIEDVTSDLNRESKELHLMSGRVVSYTIYLR
jgi:hypothetical protein